MGVVAQHRAGDTGEAMTTTLTPSPVPPTPWLTTAGAAAFLTCSQATVLRLAKAGRLPYRKVGSQYRFVLEELAAWQGTGEPVRSKPAAAPEAWQVELAGLDPYRQAS